MSKIHRSASFFDSNILVCQSPINFIVEIHKDSKGKLSIKYQKEIIRIINSLDKINIFHGDPNPKVCSDPWCKENWK